MSDQIQACTLKFVLIILFADKQKQKQVEISLEGWHHESEWPRLCFPESNRGF